MSERFVWEPAAVHPSSQPRLWSESPQDWSSPPLPPACWRLRCTRPGLHHLHNRRPLCVGHRRPLSARATGAHLGEAARQRWRCVLFPCPWPVRHAHLCSVILSSCHCVITRRYRFFVFCPTPHNTCTPPSTTCSLLGYECNQLPSRQVEHSGSEIRVLDSIWRRLHQIG